MSTRNRNFLLGFLVVVLLLAGGASYVASSQPDGLNRVAADTGIADREQEHQLGDSPLAGYEFAGVEGILGGALAGIVGVVVTLLLGAGLFMLIRRKPAESTGRSGVHPRQRGGSGSE